jgi:antitoxin MazE
MTTSVRSKVIKIGNSRGIRIPRSMIEQAGLTGEVEMVIVGDKLIIHAARRPREGWEAHFARMAEQKDDTLLDAPTPTRWDEDEWTW